MQISKTKIASSFLVVVSALFIAVFANVGSVSAVLETVGCRTSFPVVPGSGATRQVTCQDGSSISVGENLGGAFERVTFDASCISSIGNTRTGASKTVSDTGVTFSCGFGALTIGGTSTTPRDTGGDDNAGGDNAGGDPNSVGAQTGGPVFANERPDACASDDFTGNEAGTCRDSFTRCTPGSTDVRTGEPINTPIYGITDRNGDCTPFNPDEVVPLEDNPILIYIGRIIIFLSAGIGILVTVLIVVAGIRYSLARGNPQESAAAKSMIEKAVWSVILYLFSATLINWLVPGGLLN